MHILGLLTGPAVAARKAAAALGQHEQALLSSVRDSFVRPDDAVRQNFKKVRSIFRSLVL